MKTITARPPGPLPHPAVPAGISQRKVLVIGVDGLRWDRIAHARAPRLTGLAEAGLFAHGMHPLDSPARTDSGPGWSTLATGVRPEKHGVLGNDFLGRRYGRYPDFLTLAGRALPGLSTVAVVDWSSLTKHGLFGPEIAARVTFDGEAYGYRSEDVLVTDVATRVLAERDPDAAFVYLCAIDEAGHAFGAVGPEYLDAIAHVDGLVGRLLDAVEARAARAAEDWLVLVGTDHGHRDSGGHGYRSDIERSIWVIGHGTGFAPGTTLAGVSPADVAVTALAHLRAEVPDDHGFDGRCLLTPDFTGGLP